MAEDRLRLRKVEAWLGMNAVNLLRREERVFSPSVVMSVPVVPESGDGSILRDVDGKEYVDLDAGMGSLLLGYNPPPIIEIISSQTSKLHASAGWATSEAQVRLGEQIQSLFPSRERSRVLLETSSCHAVEAALKLARWHTRHDGIISLSGSLHGETYGALSVSSSSTMKRRFFGPFLPGVVFAPYPYCYRCPFKQSFPDCAYACINYLEEYILDKELPPEDSSSIILEVVQVRSCIVPPPGYFQKLRKLADTHSLLLISNESWTMPARTGNWSAIEHWNTKPDILCVGEALGGGLPIGGIVADADVMDWDPGGHTGLLGVSQLSCAASLQVLESVRAGRLVSESTKKGLHIQKRLKELQSRSEFIGDVRGKGLLVGFEVVRNQCEKTPGQVEAKEIIRRCWRKGIILGYDEGCTLRISPSLIIDIDLLDKTMETVEQVVTMVERESSPS